MTHKFSVGILLVLLLATTSNAQTRESGPWWPSSEWGPQDEAGASNRITPEKILQAIGLVTSGTMYDLGHAYEPGMPLARGRSNAIESAARAHASRSNRYAGNEEFIAGQLGQVGTRFDGLAHVGRQVAMEDGTADLVFYNGFTAAEMDGPYGFARLEVENVRPTVTRGILIDIPAYKGVDRLPNRYEVTVADLQSALARQGMTDEDLGTGDAILIRYGWAELWEQGEAYYDGSPFIGQSAAAWIATRNPTLVADDSGGPFSDVHLELLTYNGIFIVENTDLRQLALAGIYEFMFIATPLQLVGASGSPVRPIAIR